jgi:hypothetical protein
VPASAPTIQLGSLRKPSQVLPVGFQLEPKSVRRAPRTKHPRSRVPRLPAHNLAFALSAAGASVWHCPRWTRACHSGNCDCQLIVRARPVARVSS